MQFAGSHHLYLFITGISLIVAELFVGIDTGFDLLLIGLALILGSLAGLAADSFTFGLAVAAITSISYIIFGRNQLKARLNLKSKPSNIDALIGQNGIVTKPINSHQIGRVKINHETWLAKSTQSIGVGESIIATQASGITLNVIRPPKTKQNK